MFAEYTWTPGDLVQAMDRVHSIGHCLQRQFCSMQRVPLQGASVVVFAEYTWTPGDLVQAEDRAHRIGQASSVNIYMLHVKNSIDDLIWQKLQRKLEHVGQVGWLSWSSVSECPGVVRGQPGWELCRAEAASVHFRQYVLLRNAQQSASEHS